MEFFLFGILLGVFIFFLKTVVKSSGLPIYKACDKGHTWKPVEVPDGEITVCTSCGMRPGGTFYDLVAIRKYIKNPFKKD